MSPYRIGVISDTHCPERAPYSALDGIEAIFEGCDLILHAGDIETQSVLDRLAAIAPVHAVRGDHEIDTGYLPEKRVVEVGGVRIGLHHSSRPERIEMPSRLKAMITRRKGVNWNGVQEWLLNEFKDDHVQMIVFGHFHVPYNAYHDDVLIFNPGSVYKLTHESSLWRAKHSLSRVRRFTAKIEAKLHRPRKFPPVPTVGIITIDGDTIETEHIPLVPVDYAI